MSCTPIFNSGPIKPGRKVDIKALWISRTCSSVDLSTCLPGLTGQEVNIGVQVIWVFRTCPTLDLSTCLPGLEGREVNI